ncbi:MAG: class I SAM-dependent methyltransferase [Terriglobia bacterium]
MNRVHGWICSSGYWRRKLENHVLPNALEGLDLGDSVLEVGPGFGPTTDWLRTRLQRLTALEIDGRLAHSLSRRLRGTNVRVVQGDATALPFRDSSFSGAVAFTMLHHVPSVELQDRLFAEVRRVLSPGAVFAGVDNIGSLRMRILHIRDILVPVVPANLPRRLEAAGFGGVSVTVEEGAFRFAARRR